MTAPAVASPPAERLFPPQPSQATPPAAEAKPTHRVSRLDAFRGLGAIAVLVTHCFLVVPWDGGAQVFIIRLVTFLYNGHAALMTFFVISGYVLGLSLDQGADRPGNFARFYFRRVFRIYPAHLVALVLIAIALSSVDRTFRPTGSSETFGAMFPQHLSPVGGFLNALLLRAEMNGVVWTLALEVAISVVFPVLYLASRHRSAWLRMGVLVGLIAIAAAVGNRITNAGVTLILGTQNPGNAQGILQQFWYVPAILNNLVLYGWVFYIGLVAEPVFKWLVPKIEGRRIGWLMAFAWVLCLLHGSEVTPGSLIIEVTGATILVFCAALMRTRNWLIRALDHPFLNRLGEVSYSFYLYHLIVLYCVATAMFRLLDPNLVSAHPLLFVLALSLLSFLGSTAIGTWSYRLAEVPMIAYSKRPRARWVRRLLHYPQQ